MYLPYSMGYPSSVQAQGADVCRSCTVQWDTCVFAVCLAFLVTRMLRPSAHALHAMPITSAVVACVTLAALGSATSCRSWWVSCCYAVLCRPCVITAEAVGQ